MFERWHEGIDNYNAKPKRERHKMIEIESDPKIEKAIEHYLKSYHYQHNAYSVNEEGIFEVRGEDPNCDFGGPHHQPLLFVAQGKFIDILTRAVKTNNWMTCGSGGTITKLKIDKVGTGGFVRNEKEIKKIKQEISDLQKKLAELEKP